MHETGGFGAAPGHDAHMLYTCSAVQIIATLDAFDDLDAHVKDGRHKIAECMSSSRVPQHAGASAILIMYRDC